MYRNETFDYFHTAGLRLKSQAHKRNR